MAFKGAAVQSSEGQRDRWPGKCDRKGAAHLRTHWGSWLPHLSGCGDRARARARVCVAGKVGAHRLRAATAVRLGARRGRCRYTLPVGLADHGVPVPAGPGVRAPAPRAGPYARAPPPPARRAPSPARGARGARSGARRSAESGWRPPPPLPPSVASRWPSLFHLPSLPAPRPPPSSTPPPARPVQPLCPAPAGPPRCPRSYGQTHRHLQVGESPCAGRGRARRRCARVGGPFVWGRPHWGPRRRPPRRPSGDPAEPSFCSSAGVGRGAERRESGLRAGRPDVACDGLRGSGKRVETPGDRASGGGGGAAALGCLSGAGPPPAVLLSQRPRARCESGAAGSSSRVCWRWAGGRERGEKRSALLVAKSRGGYGSERGEVFSEPWPDLFPPREARRGAFWGVCEGTCIASVPYLLFLTEEGFLRRALPPPPGLRLRTVVCVCYQIRRDIDFPR